MLVGLTIKPTATPQPTLVFEAGHEGVRMDAMASLTDGLLLLELETPQENATPEGIARVQAMVRELEVTADLDGLLNAITAQVQATTGFDRVMLYRFHDDFSGDVVAETLRAPGIASFLGLRYPASDIPVQARALYLSSWIRHIPDARYQPAPIIPSHNPRTGAPLDLSFCALRSVSPIHLEYLANMGVASSTSLSLVVGGRLWGLVACHHGEPLYLSARTRVTCELYAQLASLQLQNQLAIDLATARLSNRDMQASLIGKASRSGLMESLIGPAPSLLNLIPAAGVAVIAEGVLDVEGRTPDAHAIPALLHALDKLVTDGVFATDRFEELTGITLGNGIMGVLALAISRAPKDYVVWFLPEQVHEVRWAGDPARPDAAGPDGDRLSPRKSFEAWTQTVRGRSRPWSEVEIEAATVLRVALLELVLQHVDEVSRERMAARAHQNLLMAELDHRVKNSLATIQSMVRFSSRSATDLVSFVTSIESRLQSMAKAHNLLTDSRWQGASLRALVEDELRAHDIPGGCEIAVRGAEFALDPKTALATSMAVHELVTNAIKYGCLGDAGGRLDIAWAQEEEAGNRVLAMTWSETCTRRIEPPTRNGFGRMMLERVFANDVGGALRLDFAPDGLKCRLCIPEARLRLQIGAVEQLRTLAPSRPPVRLDGLRILVVEDAALVAEDLAAGLAAAGAKVLGPYISLPEAIATAGHEAMDLALLDVDVDGEPVWRLAGILRARRVPFILTTGFSNEIERPPEFADALIVNKPYEFGDVCDAIGAVLGRRATAAS